MKSLKKLTFLLAAILFTVQAVAQVNDIPLQSCSDPTILQEADSIKQEIFKQGFILVKENSMQMESEYEMPIIVPLNQGSWYQFVFIGEYTSKLYEIRMFDWSEKQVVYIKHQWGDVDGPIIRYSYIPKFSEYHMIKPVQVNNKKKKGLCGYVMLFKKVDG